MSERNPDTEAQLPIVSKVLIGIGAICDVLQKERGALIALDAAELGAIARQKQELVDRLAGALNGEDVTVKAEGNARFLDAAVHLASEARANDLLLNDAISAISERLGLSGEHRTYDAHARVGLYVRPGASKRV